MSKTTFAKIALLLLLGAGAVGLWVSGAYENLDPESARQLLIAAGPWGALAYVVAASLMQPLGISIHLFLLTAAMVWPPAVAVTLGWLASIGSGLTAYGFARFMARSWVRKRLPERLTRYDQRLAENGFRTVVLLRLLFFTSPPLQLMLGVSRVRFAAFLAGTAVGNFPQVVVSVFAGAWLKEYTETHPPETWPWGEILPTVFAVAAMLFGAKLAWDRLRPVTGEA
ncbi:MAG: TVP38/TMEM64 family protein [Alphaproteobacteria bacterium]|nr:TVP38/TMEM64 family protein [Alphaproteobacteria bacterium]